VSLVIDENLDLALLHHTHTGVGGAQINTDNCMADMLADALTLADVYFTHRCHSSLVMGPGCLVH
jgi:hypothetical protein